MLDENGFKRNYRFCTTACYRFRPIQLCVNIEVLREGKMTNLPIFIFYKFTRSLMLGPFLKAGTSSAL